MYVIVADRLAKPPFSNDDSGPFLSSYRSEAFLFGLDDGAAGES